MFDRFGGCCTGGGADVELGRAASCGGEKLEGNLGFTGDCN